MSRSNSRKTLPAADREALLAVLQTRFEQNRARHSGLDWSAVAARLNAHPSRIWSLQQMEATGGEPDVVGQDPQTGAYLFFDCSAQSPSGRMSLCYDSEALNARREAKPRGSAVALAAEMGVELLNEDQYRHLQQLGEYDTKTSSWLNTPPTVRALGGAIFGDRRYQRVFVYHNGAQSYYSSRGFRAALTV